MKKQIATLTLVSTAVFASFGAYADTSRATANWQGVVPGVEIPSGNLIITGKDSAEIIPVGQLMRQEDGTLFGPIIDLEAREYTQADPDASPAVEAAIGGLKDATWSLEEVKFFVDGAQITSVGWEVFAGTESMGTVAADSGEVTATALAAKAQTIKLNVKSTGDSSEVDQFVGGEGAVSVTVLADDA